MCVYSVILKRIYVEHYIYIVVYLLYIYFRSIDAKLKISYTSIVNQGAEYVNEIF